MTKQGFEGALKQLTSKQREVLALFLAGKNDQEIAKSLYVAESTVRQHIRKILIKFNLKNDINDNRSSQRPNLIALFAKYQPKSLQQPLAEAENQKREDILLLNNAESNQDTATTPGIETVTVLEANLGKSDPNFVGREDAIAALTKFIKKGNRLCQIVAPGGQGKTTLAKKYLRDNFKTILEFNIAKETKDIASVEILLEEKLRQLGEEPGREFMVSLDRFKEKLQSQPIGVLFDNIEPALNLDGSGQFLPDHRRYVELLRVLSDSSLQSFTLITSRERLNEVLDIALYGLPSLTVSAWDKFWQYQGINADTHLITEIHKAYGGNALAMKVLSNLINNDYQGDIVAYWQDNKTEDNLIVETAVANLIKEQFERLKHISLDAYKLLCRLGCYRYQDVPTVPEAGLNCLLWDVAENQHKIIIRVLKERALVECNNRKYWLHPVIREVAIDKLRNSDDWEKANIQAAKFWADNHKKIETIEDAKKIFQAYYHYIFIQKFQLAANVITCKKYNIRNDQKYDLGTILFRTCLFYPILESATFLINQNISTYSKSILYNCLGANYMITDNPRQSILFCKKSIRIAKNHNLLDRYFNSFLNIGYCNILLGESEKSKLIFKDVLEELQLSKSKMSPNIYHGIYLIASFYMAYFESKLNNYEKTIFFIKETITNLPFFKNAQYLKCFTLIYLGYAYNNLNDLYESKKMFDQVIYILKIYHYPEVKGIALTGLAEIYRIQNNFQIALTHHQKSIEVLSEISAKCNLAEAYFQLALTYQQMGDEPNSKAYFDKAMYLWGSEQIDAPRQIERVKKAMNCEP